MYERQLGTESEPFYEEMYLRHQNPNFHPSAAPSQPPSVGPRALHSSMELMYERPLMATGHISQRVQPPSLYARPSYLAEMNQNSPSGVPMYQNPYLPSQTTMLPMGFNSQREMPYIHMSNVYPSVNNRPPEYWDEDERSGSGVYISPPAYIVAPPGHRDSPTPPSEVYHQHSKRPYYPPPRTPPIEKPKTRPHEVDVSAPRSSLLEEFRSNKTNRRFELTVINSPFPS